jgi:DNA-binding beta-propeller fold protein YncE
MGRKHSDFMKRYSAFFLLAFMLSGCVKENETGTKEIHPGKQLLISNEGNFQWGNASLSLYHLDSNHIISGDIFSQTNHRPLGDVLQSVTRTDGLICLVVNNSGKIEFIDEKNFDAKGIISGLRSPRYLCKAGNSSRALVTDLYDDSVAIVDLAPAFKISGKTALKGWTEQVLYIDGNFFVTNLHTRSLYVIDGISFRVSDSIPIGFGSFSIVKDDKDRIWVATKGNESLRISSQIHCIDPRSRQVLLSSDVSPGTVQCMAADEEGKNIYVVCGDVYHFSTDGRPDFSVPFFAAGKHNFYGIGTGADRIFLADAIDYTQNGNIFILDTDGNITAEFKAGKIPNGFLILN